jgi:hypothetical protein
MNHMNLSPDESFLWQKESWYLIQISTILLGILVSEVFLIVSNNFQPRMPRAIHIKKESSIRKAFYWNLRRETCTKIIAVQ